jgi:hypothetical protein
VNEGDAGLYKPDKKEWVAENRHDKSREERSQQNSKVPEDALLN